MATLYTDSAGVLVFLAGAPGSLPLAPPPEAVLPGLDFDAEVNAPLVADLRASWGRYRIVAGVLSKDGVPVVIVPDGPDERDRKLLAALKAKLASVDPLTNVEIKLALRILFRATAD